MLNKKKKKKKKKGLGCFYRILNGCIAYGGCRNQSLEKVLERCPVLLKRDTQANVYQLISNLYECVSLAQSNFSVAGEKPQRWLL